MKLTNDESRGQLAEATGVLFRFAITEKEIEETEESLGGPFAQRWPGVYFQLREVDSDRSATAHVIEQ